MHATLFAWLVLVAAVAGQPAQSDGVPPVPTKAQSPESKVSPAAPSKAQPVEAPKPDPPPIVYRGKARTASWFDAMYARFKDKVILLDGKYVDVGKAMMKPQEVGQSVPQPGTELRELPPRSRVLQVLDKGAALVRYTWSTPEIIFHISGIDTTYLTDDTPLTVVSSETRYHDHVVYTVAARVSPAGGGEATPWVVYVGKYTYESAGGATRTVQSFRPHVPLTKEEFAAALASGFVLVEYTITPAKVDAKPEPRKVPMPIP